MLNIHHQLIISAIRITMQIKMPSQPVILMGLLCLIIKEVHAAGNNTKIVCQDNFYVKYNQTAVIACDYEKTFYTVRWYFEDNDLPFLYIDGTTKGGTNEYTSGQFDINDDGSMIIKRVVPEVARIYKISVLHTNGILYSSNTAIHVIGDLFIEDCGTTNTSEICRELELTEWNHDLVCGLKNSLSVLDIIWLDLDQTGSSLIKTSDNRTLQTDDTPITYSSISTLQYNPDSFSLQYFTCVASYNEKYILNASLVVEGNNHASSKTHANKYVAEGSDLYIHCPLDPYPFGQMYAEYMDGRKEFIMQVNPVTGTTHGRCVDDNRCNVTEHRSVTIVINESHSNFQCISSNGKTSEIHVAPVTVLILPEHPVIAINNCKEEKSCNQTLLTNSGKINCSIQGVRPKVQLTLEIAEDDLETFLILKESSQTEETPQKGTFDTYLTVEYQITKCGDDVELTCAPTDELLYPFISPSYVTLVTDKNACAEESGGMIVLIILLLIIVIVAAGIVIYCWRKKQNKTKETDCELQKAESCELQEAEPLTKPNLQKEFDTIFQPLLEKILHGKATDEEFQSMLISFVSKYQDEHREPLEFLQSFVKSKTIENNDLKVLMKFFNKSTWISYSSKVVLLQTAVEKDQVQPEIWLSDDMYPIEKMSAKDFATITKSLLMRDKVQFENIMKTLKRIAATKKHSREEMANAVIKYYITDSITKEELMDVIDYTKQKPKDNYIDKKVDEEDKLLPEDDYEDLDAIQDQSLVKAEERERNFQKEISATATSTEIQYPYLLQSIQEQMEEGHSRQKLLTIFNAIMNKAVAVEGEERERNFQKEISTTATSTENLLSKFLRVLLYSVEKNVITTDDCVDMLKYGIGRHKIENTALYDAIAYCSQINLVQEKTLMTIVRSCSKERLISDDFLKQRVLKSLESEKWNPQDWVIFVDSLSHEMLITEEVRTTLLQATLNQYKWNAQTWFTFAASLAKEALITDKTRTSLLQAIIDQYKITKNDVKTLLKPLGMDADARKEMIKDIEFK